MVRTINQLRSDWQVRDLSITTIEVFDNSTNAFNDTVEKKDFNHSPGQKVYITGKCSVPRAKIKDAFKARGLKITHNIDEADHIVINKEYVEMHTSHNYATLYFKESIEKLILHAPMILSKVKATSDHCESFRRIIKTLSQLPKNDTFLEYRVTSVIDNILDEAKMTNPDGDHEYENEKGRSHNQRMINVTGKDEFLKTLKSVDKLVFEDKILSMTNGDIHMGEDLYKSLLKYFESSDPDNHTLAMETMANCNYESSAFYLLMLVKDHGRLMADHKASKYVNFRAFTRFFGLSRYDLCRMDFDEVVKTLSDKNLLKQEYIDIITPMVFKDIQNLSHYTYFKVKEIEFIPNPKSEDDEL